GRWLTTRPGSGASGAVVAVEQRAGGRADQPVEDAQAADVRSRGPPAVAGTGHGCLTKRALRRGALPTIPSHESPNLRKTRKVTSFSVSGTAHTSHHQNLEEWRSQVAALA